MDSEQDAANTRDSESKDDTSVDAGVARSAILAGSLTAGNMGSGTIGVLGGAIIGMDVDEAGDHDPAQDDKLNLDALVPYGSAKGETADRGVSTAQEETESSEMNG